MKKIAVVYWSGTGNTQAMAEAIAAAAQADLFEAPAFDASQVDGYDAIAFGCPAMGAEQLEESEFEPMFSACPRSGAKRSRCLVPTAGATANGCKPGKRNAPKRARFLRRKACCATKRPTAKPWIAARPWAGRLPKPEPSQMARRWNAEKYFGNPIDNNS